MSPYKNIFKEDWIMADRNILSDSQKRASKKYLSQFSELKIRVLPEQRDEIQAHAKRMGESTAAFMKRAILETMERDNTSSH